MDIKQIKKLMKEFEDSTIHKLNISEDSFSITMEKKTESQFYNASSLTQASEKTIKNADVVLNEKIKVEDSNYTEVKAPLVGTYYESPNPDASPYVSINQRVSKGDTLFIIEAMKVMNEIKAPVSGIIKVINVKTTSMVEFDEVVMEIEEV